MRPLWQLLSFIVLLATPAHTQNETPLSAIDWLSESVEIIERETLGEAPIATGVSTPEISVTKLDGPSNEAVGLPNSAKISLTGDIWKASRHADVAASLSEITNPTLPSLRELLIQLLIFEAVAPAQQPTDDAFLLARVDKLLDLADLQNVQDLLEIAGTEKPALFRRYFDAALLTGHENAACDMMISNPSIAPTYPARIFCLARTGDWPAAALTLNTHKALGDITDSEDLLLGLFLDPEVAELNVNLPTPERVSPLIFRMREAIGENLTTSQLPLAFAHADLRDIAGWKAQLEAAERLSRAGAIEPEILHEYYTSRRPSASGGVWDRAKTIQALDAAIADNDVSEISTLLPQAWEQFEQINAEAALSKLYASQITGLDLSDKAARSAYLMNLLSKNDPFHQNDHFDFLTGIITGSLDSIAARTDRQVAVAKGLQSQLSLAEIDSRLSEQKFGEAALHSIKLAQSAMDGNLNAMTQALIILRRLGLDVVAKQVALEFLILDRQI